MSEHEASVQVELVKVVVGRMTGMVKWFNSKSGFGFLTVCTDNEHKGKDIFVHYSAIRSSNTQYKYLTQGEYVDFDLVSMETGEHKFNASDVSGVFGGAIMCETKRTAFEQSNTNEPSSERRYTVRHQARDDDYKVVQRRQPSTPTGERQTSARPQATQTPRKPQSSRQKTA